MSGAYYNEHDPFAAAWLRELIKAGHIAPGEVDERSIEDILPSDLRPFRQHHFFAGIGVWSLALRRAGWPDDRPIWTGSCPCQPFSAAGKGGGFADERHLWPAFHHLIRALAPECVIGEQVASKDGLAWLDLVQTDVEAAGYTFGAIDTCAAGFGAPHWRQRLYWVAVAAGEGSQGRVSRSGDVSGARRRRAPQRSGCDVRLADADNRQRDRIAGGEGRERDRKARGRIKGDGQPQSGGDVCGVADAARERQNRSEEISRDRGGNGPPVSGDADRPGPLNGLWRDADWLYCRDGKWRPVEPSTFPLAHAGAFRNRVGALRGSGNALNLAQAQGFIEALIEILPPHANRARPRRTQKHEG